MGGTVSNESIIALPLNGRNFERLLQLRPGVIQTVGGTTGNSSTNGRRPGNDLLLVEGIVQIGESGTGALMKAGYRVGDASSILPIDAIQEFNTEQNPKAEYGWRDGSVINVGVKSGTNSFTARLTRLAAMPARLMRPTFSRTLSRRRLWSSSARRPADPSSRIRFSGLRTTKGCASLWDRRRSLRFHRI